MALASDGGRGTNPPLGDVFSAITALWYAAYFLAVARARRRSSAIHVMTWSTLAGLPLLAVYAIALREPLIPASAAGWAACVGLGVMHVAGQGSIAWALGRLPAATTAVVVLIQPVVAAALGWLLFAEVITPLQALGAGAALAGVALAQRAGVRAPPATAVATGPV
jgi:drug/metabolite transporter (DMT)-like permease